MARFGGERLDRGCVTVDASATENGDGTEGSATHDALFPADGGPVTYSTA
jgi:hypothetical protein